MSWDAPSLRALARSCLPHYLDFRCRPEVLETLRLLDSRGGRRRQGMQLLSSGERADGSFSPREVDA